MSYGLDLNTITRTQPIVFGTHVALSLKVISSLFIREILSHNFVD